MISYFISGASKIFEYFSSIFADKIQHLVVNFLFSCGLHFTSYIRAVILYKPRMHVHFLKIVRKK